MALHDKGEKDLCNEDPCYMVRQEDLCLLFVVVMGAMAVGLVGLVVDAVAVVYVVVWWWWSLKLPLPLPL